jgi:hypothetical protein
MKYFSIPLDWHEVTYQEVEKFVNTCMKSEQQRKLQKINDRKRDDAILQNMIDAILTEKKAGTR